MAFLKKCISTVKKCCSCGKPGIFIVEDKVYCEECNKMKENTKDSEDSDEIKN